MHGFCSERARRVPYSAWEQGTALRGYRILNAATGLAGENVCGVLRSWGLMGNAVSAGGSVVAAGWRGAPGRRQSDGQGQGGRRGLPLDPRVH